MHYLSNGNVWLSLPVGDVYGFSELQRSHLNKISQSLENFAFGADFFVWLREMVAITT
jgi:hypothetical protein